MSDFIDLALPRTIVVRQGARPQTFTVRPIPEPEWFKYFDGIVSTAVRDGNEVVQHTDAQSAGLALADSVIVMGDSKSMAARLAVANVLTATYVPSDEECAFQVDNGPAAVRLWSVWTASDAGKMRRFKNLVHWFDEPTAEQYRRYRRDDTRAQVIGGSRKGTTVYRGAQRTLAALYDELILNVVGYAANGDALDGRDEIARHMDTYHKVSAALALFAPAAVDLEEDEE
jgi:hypothetical protein